MRKIEINFVTHYPVLYHIGDDEKYFYDEEVHYQVTEEEFKKLKEYKQGVTEYQKLMRDVWDRNEKKENT